MKKNKFLVLSIIIFLLTASLVYALQYQIAYGDDSAEWLEWFYLRPYKVVLFEIEEPINLLSVETYWADNTAPEGNDYYRLRIYSTDLEPLTPWSQNIYSPDLLVWNSYDVSSYDLTFDEDFYLVVNAPSNFWFQGMALGIDLSTSANSYYWNEGGLLPRFIGNYMMRVTVEDRVPPVMDSVEPSPEPVMSGEQITLTAINADDVNEDTLQMVCGYEEPTIDDNDCTNYPQDETVPYDLTCDMVSDDNNQDDTIYCKLYDGEFYSETVEVTSTDDNEVPDVEIYLGDEAVWNTVIDDDMTVYASLSNADESGIVECEIDWDEGDGFIPIDPEETLGEYTYMSDGEYEVSYKCTDGVGWDSESSDTIVVDTTPPSDPVLTLEVQPTDYDGSVELTWTESTDENGIDRYEIYRMDTQNDWALIDTIDSAELIVVYVDGGLANGETYTYKIVAYDPAENSAESNEESTTIDTEAPTTQIINPLSSSFLDQDWVDVEVSYSDSNVVTCEISLDDAPMEDMDNDGTTDGVATYSFTGLDEGPHTLEAECTDEGGHSSTDVAKFFVDTVNPEVTIGLYADIIRLGPDYDTDGMVWAVLTNSDADPSSGYDCEIDWGDGYVPIENDVLETSYKFDTDGEKEVFYSCTDNAGNSAEASDTIFVDTVEPESSASTFSNSAECGSGSNWHQDDVEVTLQAEDPGYPETGSGVASIMYAIGEDPFTEYTDSFWITEEGVTTVSFYSTDEAGNQESPTNTLDVMIDRTEPSATIVFPVDTEHLADPNVVFMGEATDEGEETGFGSGVYQVELQIEKVSDGSIVLPWTVVNGASLWDYLWLSQENIEYIARARATDMACNMESTFEIEFTVQDDYNYLYYTEDEIDEMIQDLLDQLAELQEDQQATQEELDALQEELELILDLIDQRLTALEEFQEATEEQLTQINIWISEIQGQIAGIFEDIEDIQEQLVELSNRLTDLEELMALVLLQIDEVVSFDFTYYQVAMELHLLGNGVPLEATEALIEVWTADGNFVTEALVSVSYETPFEYTFDVSDWPYESMNIYVRYYEDVELMWSAGLAWHGRPVGPIKTAVGFFDGLLSELDYGFGTIDEKYYSTYYLDEPVERQFVYTVMPHVDGEEEEQEGGALYQIYMSQVSADSGEEIDQVIEDCVWLAADVPNYLVGSFMIPAPGEYYVRLEAYQGCADDRGGEYFTSNAFPIVLEDLSWNMPEAELIITGPEENNNDVYWTRSDNPFDLSALVFLDGATVDAEYCYVIDTTDDPFIEFDQLLPVSVPIDLGEDYIECSGTLVADEIVNGALGNGAEGVYDVMLDIRVEDAIDPTDSMNIGIDNTPPVIYELTPGETDYVRGEVIFTADVGDELSGVREVQLTLTLKNGSLIWTYPAIYNGETELWEVVVDTTQIPDGSYDLTADVYDYADNFNTLTIDPTVDNTAPILTDATVYSDICTEDGLLQFGMTVTDANPDPSSGYALVTSLNNSNITDIHVNLVADGSWYLGTLSHENLEEGTYVVTFYASDMSGNTASTSATGDASMVTCTQPSTPSSPGGGGGGGSSCTAEYECSDWSSCANGKQTRSCEKLPGCSLGSAPETEQSCTVESSSSRSSTPEPSDSSGTEDSGVSEHEGAQQDNEANTGSKDAGLAGVTGKVVETVSGESRTTAGIIAIVILGLIGTMVYFKFVKP